MIALYDLSTQLNTFDYYGWQAQVAAMGATEIVFDTRSFFQSLWPEETARKRFHSIIAPGPAFLGLPSREGIDGERLSVSSRFRHLVAFSLERSFPRMRSVLPPASGIEYTVTLRQQARKTPERNSNETVWRCFAKEIGALIIEDYDRSPLSLHERVALYAGAKMNFGTTCGPLTMCSLSEYPCVQFNWGYPWGNGFYEKAGITYGARMPWFAANHHVVWEKDTERAIWDWFNKWKET